MRTSLAVLELLVLTASVRERFKTTMMHTVAATAESIEWRITPPRYAVFLSVLNSTCASKSDVLAKTLLLPYNSNAETLDKAEVTYSTARLAIRPVHTNVMA